MVTLRSTSSHSCLLPSSCGKLSIPCSSTWGLLCLILQFMPCIQLLLIVGSCWCPLYEWSYSVDSMGPTDIILPSWSIPLYQAEGSLRKMAITRHTNVLGYPVPKDARVVSLIIWSSNGFCIVLHFLQLTFLVILSFKPPMRTWTTCSSCVGTWRPWWWTYLEIAFLGHRGAAVEVLRLIQRLLSLTVIRMMVLLQDREEDIFDTDAWSFFFLFFNFFLFALIPKQFYYFYSQNIRMYSF